MLTLEIAEKAVDLMEEAGIDASVYEDYEVYSGRCMYGNTCVGITTGASGAVLGHYITAAYVELHEGEIESGRDAIETIIKAQRYLPKRTDSMGYDTIYY